MSRRKKTGGGKRRAALDHDEPYRTCVACRASRPRDEMLRFARAPDGELGFDVRAKLPGRGAWTCASPSCVKKAVDKGGFERAFEEPVLAKAEPLASTVRATLEGELRAGLGLLKKSNRLAAGREDVARQLEAAIALVLARDLSERSRGDVQRSAGARIVVVTALSQADIGTAIGRKPTGVLALLDGPRAALVLADAQRLGAFAGTSVSATTQAGATDSTAKPAKDGAVS